MVGRKSKYKTQDGGKFVINVLVVLGLCLVVFLVCFLMKSGWSRDFKYSIALAGKNRLGLLTIDPVEKKVFVLTVPENMMMPVPGMKGDIRSAAVWKFGEGEDKAITITERAMEIFLGTKIDRLVYDGEWDGGIEKISWKMFVKPSMTDLPMVDRVRLAWFLLNTRKDQWKIDEVPLSLGVEETLPDGTKMVNVDRERLASIREKLINEKMLQSDLRVIVENDSGVDAMGVLVETMLESAGGLVSQVKQGEVIDGWCNVVINKADQKDVVVRYLAQKFGCKVSFENLANFEVRLKVGKLWGKVYDR